MEWLVLVGLLAAVFGGLGAWIATQRRRDSSEGFKLGLVFGPLGVLVEALLPQGSRQAQVGAYGGQAQKNIDEQGMIAFIAERFLSALEDADPNWEKLSRHRKRGLLKPVERQPIKELKLSPTTFSDYAAEARRFFF